MGLVALLLALLGSPASADEAGDPALTGEALRLQVQRWIEGLRADDYAVREAARIGLKKYAPAAREQIEAAANDPDPEVRRTLRSVLDPARASRPTTTKVDDLAHVGRVTFDYRDVPLPKALQAFGTAFGGRFVVPDTHKERRVTAKASAVPYFQGLALVLRPVGLQPEPFDRGGTSTLIEGDPLALPCGASGPIWVRVVGRQTTVRFGPNQPPPSYGIDLEVWWPPSVHCAQMRALRVEVARDGKGTAFTGRAARTTYGIGTNTFRRALQVTVQAPNDAHGDKLTTLEVAVPLRLQHGVQSLRTEASAMPVVLGANGEPVPVLGADGSVAFRTLKAQENRPTTWVAEVAAVLRDELARQTAQVGMTSATGQPSARYIATSRSESADGILHLTARAYNIGKERPRAISLRWFTQEVEGQVRVRLENISLR